MMNVVALLQHHYLRAIRSALGHSAVGLGTSWCVLSVFELWRPVSVAWYLDLNLLLLISLLAWVLGEPPAATLWRGAYLCFATSVILMIGTALVLALATPWAWWAPPIALLGLLLVWRVLPPRS